MLSQQIKLFGITLLACAGCASDTQSPSTSSLIVSRAIAEGSGKSAYGYEIEVQNTSDGPRIWSRGNYGDGNFFYTMSKCLDKASKNISDYKKKQVRNGSLRVAGYICTQLKTEREVTDRLKVVIGPQAVSCNSNSVSRIKTNFGTLWVSGCSESYKSISRF